MLTRKFKLGGFHRFRPPGRSSSGTASINSTQLSGDTGGAARMQLISFFFQKLYSFNLCNAVQIKGYISVLGANLKYL